MEDAAPAPAPDGAAAPDVDEPDEESAALEAPDSLVFPPSEDEPLLEEELSLDDPAPSVSFFLALPLDAAARLSVR